MPPGRLPVPTLAVHARQQGSETSGLDKRVSANFTARVENEPGGLSALDFLVLGDFDASGGKFEWLSLLLMPDLDGNLAADECDGVRIEEWGNGQQKAVLELDIAGAVYTARDTACLAEKLPAPIAAEAAFTVAQFGAIAASLVEDGTIAGVVHDGLRTFLEQAARGEVSIVPAPLFAIPAGIPVPAHQLDVKVGTIETQDDGTLVVPLYAEVGPLGLGFEELEFLLIGQYGVPFKNFIDLEILMVEPVKSSVAKAVEECRRMRIEDWGDGKRIVFQLNRAMNRFAAQGGECVLAALDEQHAAEARFLFDSFADIASSMFQTGVAQNLSTPDLTVFFERAAKGEITFAR